MPYIDFAKKEPMHPGRIFNRLLLKDQAIEAVAQQAGIPTATLEAFSKEEAPLTEELRDKLSSVFKAGAMENLFAIQKRRDYFQIHGCRPPRAVPES